MINYTGLVIRCNDCGRRTYDPYRVHVDGTMPAPNRCRECFEQAVRRYVREANFRAVYEETNTNLSE